MPSEQNQERPGFSGLVADLIDSDVVIEIASTHSSRQTLENGPIGRLKDALAASYNALAGQVQIELETVAVLEELPRHSLSTWLRARPSGDGAHADTDASLFKFLARGTLAIIAWMDGSPTLQLADLQQAIRVLAWGTSITTSAQPALPASSALVDAVTAWQVAKRSLKHNEKVRIVTNNGSAKLDLAKLIEEPRTLLLTRKVVNHSAEMIFLVEMPDYQGTGVWHLKHGGARTTAKAESGTLLDRFYRRELDIRPGDALRCKVDLEIFYGPDHEVLAERYRIIDILEVLPAIRTDTDASDARAVNEAPSIAERAHELEPAVS